MTLENLKTYALSQVDYFWRQGVISDQTWEAYLHLWQTGAPRFGRRQCHCDACKISYPSPEF